jgi:hypothetical protein
MVSRRLALLLSMLFPVICHAGPIAETFGSGVLGIPWGATLDQLTGVYSDGDNVFSTAPGHRSYWVRDGAELLGVPRDHQGVLYGLDAQDHVVTATVAFAFERKEQVRSILLTVLGRPRCATEAQSITSCQWTGEPAMSVVLREFSEPRHSIVWLTVLGPGYKARTRLALCQRRPLTIVGGGRDAWYVWHRGCGKTVCTRGSNRAPACGPSTSPLDRTYAAAPSPPRPCLRLFVAKG